MYIYIIIPTDHSVIHSNHSTTMSSSQGTPPESVVATPKPKRPKVDGSSHSTYGRFSFSHEWSIDGLYALLPTIEKDIESPLFTCIDAVDLQWQLVIYKRDRYCTSGIQVGLRFVGSSLVTSDNAQSCALTNTSNPQVVVEYSLSTCGLNQATRKSEPALLKKGTAQKVNFIEADRIKTYSSNGKFTMRCNITVWQIDKPFYSPSDWHSSTVQPNEHVTKLMETIYLERQHTDVTFVAEGEEIKAHKCILSANSDVLQRMLQQPMKEATSNIIEVTDITIETMEAMLEFMYTGRVKEMDRNIAAALLAVAEKYNMQAMKVLCLIELHHRLNTSNVVDTLHLARLYRSKELKETCIKYIAHNKEAIRHTADWKRLNRDFDVVLAFSE